MFYFTRAFFFLLEVFMKLYVDEGMPFTVLQGYPKSLQKKVESEENSILKYHQWVVMIIP